MVRWIPSKNRFLAFFGDGRYECDKHPSSPTWRYLCADCIADELKKQRQRERQERIEEHAEAIMLANKRMADEARKGHP